MLAPRRCNRLALLGCRAHVRRETNSSPAPAPPPPLLSDERIVVGPGYNRWLQLGPTTLAGLGIGAYFTVPGVLGPSLCKAQGVVAQASTDFSMSTLVPTLTLMPLVAATLAAGLARTSDDVGVRRLGLAASIVYPMGVYVLPAAAVAANSLYAFAPCYALVGGIGFFAGYPQIPPFLMRWFPDRKGLALSLYGATFGSSVLFFAPFINAVQPCFKRDPTRLGSLDQVATHTLGAMGDAPGGAGAAQAGGGRAAFVGGEEVHVVVATARDLAETGFSHLQPGVFLLDGSNGACQTMAVVGAVVAGMMQIAAWSYRLPRTDAAQVSLVAGGCDNGGNDIGGSKGGGQDTVGGEDGRYYIGGGEGVVGAAWDLRGTNKDATRGAGAAGLKRAPAAPLSPVAPVAPSPPSAPDEVAARSQPTPTPSEGDLTLGEAMSTPQLYLLGLGLTGVAATGLPFLMGGKFMLLDIFGAAGGAPGASDAAVLAAAGFPSLLAAANMGGRLAWGPISDRVGAGTTLALFGLSVPSLLLCPAATGMVPTDPHTALLLFRAGAVGTLFCFAGAPVMIAPAAAELFGHQAAGQIYRRLWITVPVANVVANLLVTRARDLSYYQHAGRIAALCDDACFLSTFGAPKSETASLIASKTLTIPLLLQIAPPGTPDPSHLLYDQVLYALAASSAAAFACNLLAFRLPLRRAAHGAVKRA